MLVVESVGTSQLTLPYLIIQQIKCYSFTGNANMLEWEVCAAKA